MFAVYKAITESAEVAGRISYMQAPLGVITSASVHSAVKRGDLERVRYLVRLKGLRSHVAIALCNGCQRQIPLDVPRTLLIFLILGATDVTRTLHVFQVEVEGLGVDQRDEWDATPLFYASLRGDLKMVAFLLENGSRCEEKVIPCHLIWMTTYVSLLFALGWTATL